MGGTFLLNLATFFRFCNGQKVKVTVTSHPSHPLRNTLRKRRHIWHRRPPSVLRGICWAPRCVSTGVAGPFPVLCGLFLLFIGTGAVESIVWLLPRIRLLFFRMAACQGRKKMITQSKVLLAAAESTENASPPQRRRDRVQVEASSHLSLLVNSTKTHTHTQVMSRRPFWTTEHLTKWALCCLFKGSGSNRNTVYTIQCNMWRLYFRALLVTTSSLLKPSLASLLSWF